MQLLAALALITATQHSGYVRPQSRFSVTCSVSVDGKLHSDLYSDFSTGQWARHEVVERVLSAEELSRIQLLISESLNGPFEHGQNPCDIGGTSIVAHLGNNAELAIFNSVDCGPRTINLSPSAKNLATWVRKECKLK